MQTIEASAWAITRRAERVAVCAALFASFCLTACKVVPIEADRAARERLTANFNAERYVEGIWQRQALIYWSKSAQPASELMAKVERDLAVTGSSQGRQAGDGSPWTFVVKGDGAVMAVETERRAGQIVVAVDGRPVTLRVGPVVSGASLRDSLPAITFNDFSDQIAFADVGRALTMRAMKDVRPVATTLKVGDKVSFAGAASVSDGHEPLVLTPYRLERLGG